MLIHIICAIFITLNTNTNELLVSCISDFIFVCIEGGDNQIPFIKFVRRTKSSEVIMGLPSVVHLKKNLRSQGVFL